jgi:hypothetical protein
MRWCANDTHVMVQLNQGCGHKNGFSKRPLEQPINKPNGHLNGYLNGHVNNHLATQS